MLPGAVAAAKPKSQLKIDKRIWPMIMLIGVLGFIVTKEISLPAPIIAGCGILGLLGLLVTGIQHPEIPLYVLVAYLPFSKILTGDFGTTAFAFNMTNILIVWVLIAYGMKSAGVKQRVPMGSALNKVIWLFCLMGVAAMARAGFEFGGVYVDQMMPMLKRWLTPVLLYFLVLWVVRDKKTIRTIVAMIMVVLVIVSLMAIRDYMYVDDSDLEKARVGGIADHSNTLAAFFVYYMFLFYGFVLTFFKKNKKVVWLLIPLLLCFRGIMVTFSRGAYLGFAAGLLTGAFFRSKVLCLAMIAAGVFAVATPGVLPAGIRYRLGQTMTASGPQLYEQDITQSLEASASHRIDIWRAALRMIEQNPMWGIGYGAFPLAAPHYSDRIKEPVDAHNTYLLIAAEMGIPTLAVFLVVLLVALYYTWWLYRKTQDLWMKAIALGFLAGLGGLLVVNMFGSRMDDQAVASYFWMLCALIMRGVHMERQEIKQARLAKAASARGGSALGGKPAAA